MRAGWSSPARTRPSTHPILARPDSPGSLIVAEFPSLDDAKRWAAEDPYTTGGVFAKVTVKPFRQVLP